MDPLTLAAIMGGTQLLGGLFGAASQRETAEKQGLMQAAQNQYAMQQQARQSAEQQQQGALNQLIDAWRSSLVGK